jgi:hypothetical protein
MTVSGHVWQEEPYVNNSQEIGYNPLSQWLGSRGQHGAGGHFEIVLESAGGKDHVPGDYLYRSLISLINGGDMQAGLWGIFRASLPGKDAVVITKAEAGRQELTIEGVNTVNPGTGDFAQTVQLFGGALKEQTNDCTGAPFATVQVDQTNGHWKYRTNP